MNVPALVFSIIVGVVVAVAVNLWIWGDKSILRRKKRKHDIT